MLGVGISAIGVIAMILYYRHQQNAAQTAPANSGMGSFPYFQTAAVPSSMGGGGSTMAATSATPAASAANPDLASVLTAGTTQTMTSLIDDLTMQQNSLLAGAGQPSQLTTGFIQPSTGGGFNFGINSGSVFSPVTNNPYVFTPQNVAAGTGQQVTPNSTNGLPPRQSILTGNTTVH